MTTRYHIDILDAQAILKPRIQQLAYALQKSVHEWNTGLGGYHTVLDEYGRAVIINQFWYSFSQQLLFSDTGVTYNQVGNGKYIVVDDAVVLRFKHLDQSFKPRNYPTTRSEAWGGNSIFEVSHRTQGSIWGTVWI